MAQKKVVAIHDISCYGRCSLTVALPILSAAGINAPVIPTAVLSTYVGPFPDFTYRDMTEDIIPIVKHWKDMGFDFDAVYTGFLGSKDQVDVVRRAIAMIKGPETKVYVDPVMADNGVLYSTFGPDFPPEMRKLCGDADLIMPNITELTLMLGEPYKEGPYAEAYIMDLLRKSEALGARKVVLTGVYFDEEELGTAAYDCETHQVQYVMKKRVPGYYHGTGDIFGSGLVAALVHGWTLPEAVDITEDLTISSIRKTIDDGEDVKNGVNFESSLSGFGARVSRARGHRFITEKKDISKASTMASEIWHEAYADMVGKDQTEYMLEKYLSPESIGRQISEGTVYEFITDRGDDAGFIAYRKDGERLFLSKFYIKKEYRRSGLATHSMRHIADVAGRMGLRSVYLTVNRGNKRAISAYEHMGFVALEDVDTDIGNGFFMYDHIMELQVDKN